MKPRLRWYGFEARARERTYRRGIRRPWRPLPYVGDFEDSYSKPREVYEGSVSALERCDEFIPTRIPFKESASW